MNKESLYNFLLFLVFAITLFSAGFYFGYRNVSQEKEEITAKQNVEQNLADLSTELNVKAEQNGSLADSSMQKEKEIKDVFWLQAGEPPVCPPEYPIKGKFDSPVNIFYSPENKFYDRVVPQVCFQSVSFARHIAGFIQKF